MIKYKRDSAKYFNAEQFICLPSFNSYILSDIYIIYLWVYNIVFLPPLCSSTFLCKWNITQPSDALTIIIYCKDIYISNI